MAQTFLNINIGEGLDNLKFGMTQQEVTDLLGKPDEVETEEMEDDMEVEFWHYDEHEMSLSFDVSDLTTLNSISVSGDEFKFQGEYLIGEAKGKVLDILARLIDSDLEVDEITPEDDPNQQMVVIDELSASFWFEDGELCEIHWGPFYEE